MMRKLLELIEEIHKLDEELAKFEKKYGLMSDDFYEWYCSGEEPEDEGWVQDFALWAGTYKLKLRREEKYRRLLAEMLTRKSMSHLMREVALAGAS